MCIFYLQSLETHAVREAVSPDRDRHRKTPTRDGELTHNTEVSFTQVLSHEDVPVGADDCMGETRVL
jgi:hypothetical protein